ncbi:tRNA lysidine(34) synthetase [Brevundimonas sp. PAMC22021]|uniref:tRNA lysidine(34) synthetase n=1 Tax=Brevundimonas sp. PAMC22021 TaxID=2861285 RepID=UPI001C628CAB|nr:tRNA lysidine(34) synthetase [Brevundimonas sp. PAMC22021]QYF86325.1 tRNA lysidine(34) synthetase TilS [Brevundimonas sp. PAMC22021]
MRRLIEPDLEARVCARLDARLSRNIDAPVCVALSGGGDSLALLQIASVWAKDRGRRLLALTVDHGLHPLSGEWTAFAGAQARRCGAEWRALAWQGPKPETGLTAAARLARHRLIADAARHAGARVVLFGHTADDVDEAEWMRARGSTLGRMREWSPSPVWPQGRGLMLLRPMLAERREPLRRWLGPRGSSWIDDPANDDPRYGRARARLALAGEAAAAVGSARRPLLGDPPQAIDGEGFRCARQVGRQALAAALVCAGGGEAQPRREQLQALMSRLASGEDFVATLSGARLEAKGPDLAILREAGELRRRAAEPLVLQPGTATVWDGRIELQAREPGWAVAAAQGRMAQLSDLDRACLSRLPAPARASWPVLMHEKSGPVLSSEAVSVRGLTAQRLRLALSRASGETTHEDDLRSPADGEGPWNPLCLGAEHMDRRSGDDCWTTEDINEPA